jgi:hypothetical protein
MKYILGISKSSELEKEKISGVNRKRQVRRILIIRLSGLMMSLL